MTLVHSHPTTRQWVTFAATGCVALLGAVLMAAGGGLVQQIDRLAGDPAAAQAALAAACVTSAPHCPARSGCAMVGRLDLNRPDGGI
jgi:hypothetical protein